VLKGSNVGGLKNLLDLITRGCLGSNAQPHTLLSFQEQEAKCLPISTLGRDRQTIKFFAVHPFILRLITDAAVSIT
jgi:hypothetical protein